MSPDVPGLGESVLDLLKALGSVDARAPVTLVAANLCAGMAEI